MAARNLRFTLASWRGGQSTTCTQHSNLTSLLLVMAVQPPPGSSVIALVCSMADLVGVVGSAESVQKHSTDHSNGIHIPMPFGLLKDRKEGEGEVEVEVEGEGEGEVEGKGEVEGEGEVEVEVKGEGRGRGRERGRERGGGGGGRGSKEGVGKDTPMGEDLYVQCQNVQEW